VGRFGQQRDGVGPESADALNERESAQHRERDPQALLTRILSAVMMVVMAIIVAVAAVALIVIIVTTMLCVVGTIVAAVVVVRGMPAGWVICLSHVKIRRLPGLGRVSIAHHSQRRQRRRRGANLLMVAAGQYH
jgi:hypothetical protein